MNVEALLKPWCAPTAKKLASVLTCESANDPPFDVFTVVNGGEIPN